MDDLLSEFLTETNESLDLVDVELVKFEQNPNNAKILDNIFRLVHTVKGTCGFLGLPRLEALAHAAETLMGKYRDGATVTQEGVSLILASIDRLKAILADLEATGEEPSGEDHDLISELERMSECQQSADEEAAHDIEGVEAAGDLADIGLENQAPAQPEEERELRPGEVSLEELERAFQEAESDFDAKGAAQEAAHEAISAVRQEMAAKAQEQKKPEQEQPEAKTDAQSKGVANQSIRVAVDTLEHLMTMVSELVLTRNQLLEIARRHEDSEFKVPLQRLSNVTAELQEGVMKTRMQPIGNAWQKLPRIVRDLANELGKQIELDMKGADTELDRQVLELIKDPLTHMVRNSADHGLESPEERKKLGKPEKGTIRLAAFHEGGHIIIQISDNGKGLDVEKLKQKAIDNGIVSESEAEKMTEAQVHKLIFHAGFSTAAQVTNVSGRGVGMDVVRNNIELIGGNIDLKSEVGKGTTFTIKIPLTLAIVSALIVEAAEERFAIPQISVVELVRVQAGSEHKIERIKDTPVLRLRNKLLPLSHLSGLLGLTDKDTVRTDDEGFVIVMQVGNQTFGLIVDAVFHTEEIVVKPMSTMLRSLTMFSGNTILGDGSVIMIIDPNGVAQFIGSSLEEELDTHETTETVGRSADEATSLLIFKAGSDQPKAVPLSLVTRLEDIPVDKIEHSNGRDLVQYRGHLMPLVYVDEYSGRKESGTQPMLVFADSQNAMGLVVDEIVDIVEAVLTIEVQSDRSGILGSAVIKGKATEVVDVGHYLPMASDNWFAPNDTLEIEERKKSIMLVDDSAFFRNMLAPVLKSAGYEVTVCENADEALTCLEKGKVFDAIVTDIEMPGTNGYIFTESLRSMEEFRDLPIIAMSSHTTISAIERGREAGFTDYIGKFDRSGLINVLKEQVTKSGAVA
jgi:two-component system chemotaxis sensor kinase CheA